MRSVAGGATLALATAFGPGSVDGAERAPGTGAVVSPVLADRDLDEVPDDRDNCPNVANARPSGGEQPLVCGSGFRKAIDRFVFLESRTFLPREGVDPAL